MSTQEHLLLQDTGSVPSIDTVADDLLQPQLQGTPGPSFGPLKLQAPI